MQQARRTEIIGLLNQEVVPALGCTEPAAVALAAAKARALLGEYPDTIQVWVSANIYKNGMGVGVPGTGMNGLPIAAALGALGGEADASLEVLRDVRPEHVESARRMLEENRVRISVKPDVEGVFVECLCQKGEHETRVVIRDRHSAVTRIEKDGRVLLDEERPAAQAAGSDSERQMLDINEVWEFALTAPLEDIEFLLEGAELNKTAAREGLRGTYGLQVGKRIAARIASGVLGDDLGNTAMSLTAAACDARMAGSMTPVMSNSGSGNQGLTAMLPVLAASEKLGSTREQLIRALALSNLVAIHLKAGLGRLSALCGCVVAATGASCGIAYLLGGKLDQVKSAIQNMAANISGMICDGAKGGCALKVSTGVNAAVHSALLACEGATVSDNDGIIAFDVEQTIRNLATLGTVGMAHTDRVILEIMVDKQESRMMNDEWLPQKNSWVDSGSGRLPSV